MQRGAVRPAGADAGPLRQVHGGTHPDHRYLEKTDGMDKYQDRVAMHRRTGTAGMADGKTRELEDMLQDAAGRVSPALVAALWYLPIQLAA